jgi:hypothetical protein
MKQPVKTRWSLVVLAVLVALPTFAATDLRLTPPGGDLRPVFSSAAQDYSVLSVEAFHTASIMVTDPQHRSTGFDSATDQRHSEIPNSHYDDNTGISDDETGEPPALIGKEVEITPVPGGTYTLTIWPEGRHRVDLDIHVADTNQVQSRSITLNDVPANGKAPLIFTISVDTQDLSKLAVTYPGAFIADPPGPGAQLITYANPRKHGVYLTKKTKTYALTLFYALDIQPTAFRATVNGKDIARLFHPRPGFAETVHLTGFHDGVNTLVLAIQGTGPAAAVKHEDTFTIAKE